MPTITQETCDDVKHNLKQLRAPPQYGHAYVMEGPYRDIASRLDIAINALGMEPAAVARSAGLKPNALYNYLSGDYRIGLNAALQLREAYGLPLDWIYCGGSVDKLPTSVRSALASNPRDNHSK